MRRLVRPVAHPRGTLRGHRPSRGAVDLDPGGAVSVRSALLTAGLILLLLALFACDDSYSPTYPGDGPIAFATVAQAEVGGVLGEQCREVVRDQATWAAVWADLRPDLAGPPPAVDFGQDVVAVVAMATEPCVARVEVREVVDQGAAVTVAAVEHPTADNCVCIQPVRPFHAVRFPRRSEPITFAVTTGAPAACG